MCRCGMLPLELLVRGVQEPHKAIQADPVVFSCPAEFDGKALLRKTPHTLVTGHGGVILVLTWKLPCCWLAFTVLEVFFGLLVDRRQQPFPIVNPKSYTGRTDLERYAHRYNSNANVMELPICFLKGFKAHSK